MKKLLVILILSFTWLQALDLDEMIHQEYDEITPGECEVSLAKDIKIGVCSLTGAMNAYEDKLTMIMGHFYSSYYKILAEHISTQDKHKINNMVKNMLAKQDECEEMASNIDLPEDANPIIPDLELTSCMQDEFGESFYELSNFIYENPKYKHIFDEIFTPNPKEYYEFMKSHSNSEFLLKNILQKAAQDNLIDKTGKLIAHTNELIKPSFDCTKAKSEVEKLICSNKETASLDKLYSKLYFGILNSIPKDTKLGQTTRANLKTFNKNLLEYRDNMRCFFLDYNNNEKEVQETNEILGDNGVPLYAYLSIVRYGFSTQEQKQACVQRVYLMGILLLATNTLQDSADLKGEYSGSEPYFLDIFSIKYLHNFELYDTFFPKEFKDKLSKITKTLGYLSDLSRFSGHGYYYEEDTGFICTGGECDTDTMKNEVEKPVKDFVKKIKLRD
ncbi:hypothetical protein DMB95_00255 [Campylobacter sp. MIT 12-8780]|uniref:hypothetical protein n=1 Tax=Campylobacter sp. MIT 12-8780 TaxID=2202200 RepID=UPI00115D9421|nr:hypothetical protein [Campylobacter sp. MIT 12-8780]TQR42968.1 hypothetical protein DMB95_00255 [Campylobacter sp. MIT 12-8780]